METKLSYHELNAMLNIYDDNNQIQFDKDKQAAKAYFLDHVNQNTVFFHSLEEKLGYLVENAYYENLLRICLSMHIHISLDSLLS
jgi:ribonucleoside-diphosphate reductase alpha chain